MINLYSQKDTNIRKTWLLMIVFLILVIFLGYVFAIAVHNVDILYIAIGLSLVMNILAYWQSDKIALATSRATPANPDTYRDLYHIVENLSITAGLPVPRIYVMPSQQINAFATGRDPKHAAVAVTQGALDKLTKTELEGVLAHELSHVGNRDILISSVAVVLAGVIAVLADIFTRSMFWSRSSDDRKGGGAILLAIGIVAAILAPLAATLIRLAISRKREYLADASGALLTRYPEGLANALEKIAEDETPMRAASSATAHLYISNPFKGDDKTSWIAKLFMTHPPIHDRIRVLRGMEF